MFETIPHGQAIPIGSRHGAQNSAKNGSESMQTPKPFSYTVYHPGEIGAGIFSFSDTITITVESGDPGGDLTGEDSFGQWMLEALQEWYDGATVQLQE